MEGPIKYDLQGLPAERTGESSDNIIGKILMDEIDCDTYNCAGKFF
jgi:hypothetical protein